ncbi:MAG: zincin-like metallopeptidase domain-containing protein [Gammaproteobacteria bacterium]|nr:zincin-like metallopeptidase domain-containing protein [Gammaproteobacteria bacterium]
MEIEYCSYAAYSPSGDVVMMPTLEHYSVTAEQIDRNATTDGVAQYWATLWHEVVHWTVHESRLDRERHLEWGDAIYAFEELVAELGSAYLCGYLESKGNFSTLSTLINGIDNLVGNGTQMVIPCPP